MDDGILHPTCCIDSLGRVVSFFCISFSSLYPFLKAFSSLLSNTLHDLLNVNITSFLSFLLIDIGKCFGSPWRHSD